MKNIRQFIFIFISALSCEWAYCQNPSSDTATAITEGETITVAPSQVLIADWEKYSGDLGTDSITAPKKVYLFPIREDIMPSTYRLVEKCLKEAATDSADYVIIDMNTYGGLVDAADKIRTAILHYPKPIYVFINNQAASAGALIAIAADSIYMRDGASIGAATVVDQQGEVVADKYQSFMRGMMRATAESHGKVVDHVSARGDTVWRWFRDPRIAEAMVDPSISIPGLIDSTKVLSFSTGEAIEWRYCEGRAQSVEEVLTIAGLENYTISEYKPTFLDRILGFLTNPAFQGLLIMLIIGGIYFELQTPGVGFPLIAAIAGAVLYFAPLYLEGLAAHWEVALFLLGVILIIVEIFVTPGFGVLGILGIIGIIMGLTFAMIDTDVVKYIPSGQIGAGYLLRPVSLVIISVTASLILCIWLGKRLLTTESPLRRKVVLTSNMEAEEGYVSHSVSRDMVGRTGTVLNPLRPSGKVIIDNVIYEAAGENGQFIDRDTQITVVRDEGGILYCRMKFE